MNRTDGQLIYEEAQAFELRWHTPQVLAWNRKYDEDGQPTDTWTSLDVGTPDQAKRIWPGLASQIDKMCQ